MADEKELVVKLALKAGGYREQIKGINNDTKVLKSEFDKAKSGAKDFESSLEGQKAKLKLVSGEYENTKKKLEIYKQQLKKCDDTLKESSRSYAEQEKYVKSLKGQIEDYSKAYGKGSDAVKALEKELKQAENALESKRKAVISADNSMKTMQTTVNKTEAESNRLSNEMKDLSSSIEKAGNEATEAGNDIKGLGNNMDQAKNDAIDFGAKMTLIGEGMTTVGEEVTQAGNKITSKMKEVVKTGAEYNASVASTKFLMNNLDKATQDWINTNAKSANGIGLTEKQYKELAVSVAGYGENMGLSGATTNKFTDNIMNLSANLAALKDVPVSEALRDVKSALMGNYEAVDKYNVNLSANMLGNSAYVKSLGKSWNKLSDNEKMQAALNEMLRQGASANGLAAQEADQFSMKSKLLEEQINETTGVLGESLLPILEPIVNKISDIVKNLSGFIEANPKLAQGILLVVGVLGLILSVLGPFITTIGMLVISIGAISAAFTAAGGAAAFLSATILPVIAVIAGLILIGVVLYNSIKANWDGIKQATQELFDKCAPQFESLKQSFSRLWETCQSIYNTVIAPLFKIIGEIIAECIRLAAPILQNLMTVFGIVFDTISIVWNSIGKPVFSFIISIVRQVWSICQPIFSSMGSLFSSICNAISSVWNGVLKPVFTVLMSIVQKVGSVVSPVFSSFKSIIMGAMNAVLTPIQWVIDKLSTLFNWISDVGNKVGGFLSKINPFKSIDGNVGVNYSVQSNNNPMARAMPGLENIAMSGSYYQADTFRASAIGEFSKINIPVPNIVESRAKVDNTEKLLKEMISTLKNLKQGDNIYNIISPKATASEIRAELKRLDKQVVLGF